MGGSESRCCADSTSKKPSVSYEANLKNGCESPVSPNESIESRSSSENSKQRHDKSAVTAKQSPTKGIDSLDLLKDPRSPAQPGVRTPISYSTCPKPVDRMPLPLKYDLNDPRSPTQDLPRTPIIVIEEGEGSPNSLCEESEETAISKSQDNIDYPARNQQEENQSVYYTPAKTPAPSNILDPRSPTFAMDRTPLSLLERSSQSSATGPTNAPNSNDPRSPTSDVSRTPLNIFYGDQKNLRKTVLMSNALMASKPGGNSKEATTIPDYEGDGDSEEEEIPEVYTITNLLEISCSSSMVASIGSEVDCTSLDDSVPSAYSIEEIIDMNSSVVDEVAEQLHEQIIDENAPVYDNIDNLSEIQENHDVENGGNESDMIFMRPIITENDLQKEACDVIELDNAELVEHKNDVGLSENKQEISEVDDAVPYTELASNPDQVISDSWIDDISSIPVQNLDSQTISNVVAEEIDNLRLVNGDTSPVKQESEDLKALGFDQTSSSNTCSADFENQEVENTQNEAMEVMNDLDIDSNKVDFDPTNGHYGNGDSMVKVQVLQTTDIETEAKDEPNEMATQNQTSSDVSLLSSVPEQEQSEQEFQEPISTEIIENTTKCDEVLEEDISTEVADCIKPKEFDDKMEEDRNKSPDLMENGMKHTDGLISSKVEDTISEGKASDQGITKSLRQIRPPTVISHPRESIEQKQNSMSSTKPLMSKTRSDNNKKGKPACRLPKKIPSLRKSEGKLSSTQSVRSPLAVLCYENNSPNSDLGQKFKTQSPKQSDVLTTKIPRYQGTPPALCDRSLSLRNTKAVRRCQSLDNSGLPQLSQSYGKEN